MVLGVSAPALETSRLISFSKSSVSLIGNYFLTHDKTRREFLCFFESLRSPINQEEREWRSFSASLQKLPSKRQQNQETFLNDVSPTSRIYIYVICLFFYSITVAFYDTDSSSRLDNCDSISDRNWNSLFPIGESRPALTPAQFTLKRVPATFLTRVKRQERETDKSYSSNDENKNSWSFTPTSTALNCMEMLRHQHGFTFALLQRFLQIFQISCSATNVKHVAII